MKKLIIVLIIISIIIISGICYYKYQKNNMLDGDGMIMIKESELELEINGKTFLLELEDNDAVSTLANKLKDGDISVTLSQYGGFEYVGNLNFSLPTSDRRMTTEPGDVVLYQGNQLVVFYGSNTWEYTKIGHLKDVDSSLLKNAFQEEKNSVTLRLNK